MTQPPTNDRTHQLRQEIANKELEHFIYSYKLGEHQEKELRDIIVLLIAAEQQALLDRIAQSVKQHTVPEGIDLVTRSYVLNTLEFERSSLKAELGGEAE